MRGPQYLHRLRTEVRVSSASEVGAQRYVWGAVPEWGRDVQWDGNGRNRAQPVHGGIVKFVFFPIDNSEPPKLWSNLKTGF